ncbi:MAG: ATP-binding cassette domain-containing protein [Anaerolineales bacterium]|nr:ATP-binding cassette domain-containing protein [Anaerolineales bacterium]
MTELIKTIDLSKNFGDFQAVDGVSLHVDAGEILALLGPNGAGKTTTIRMLAAILEPTRGSAYVAGYDVALDKSEVRRSLGVLTEHHGLYTRMRANEYLEFFGRAYGMSKQDIFERSEVLLDKLELSRDLDKRLGEYSKGMRQKLALARALLHDPPVLLLDEPTSAMDPASARLVRESISSLRSSKRAILICTHNLSEAEGLADRIAIIRTGKIIAQGNPIELKDSLLGTPIMEVRLVDSLNGVEPSLPEGATLIDCGENWIRFVTTDPLSVNPQVLELLAEAGHRVVTLSQVWRSLEEVYLRVVLGDEVTEGSER